MSLDVYDMARQVEHDRRDRHLRTVNIDQPEIAPVHRPPLVVGLGRAFNRIGDYLQGIPAPVAQDLSPEPTAG